MGEGVRVVKISNFNQHGLIKKLNEYLKIHQRSFTLSSGYCHGIVLLWLYKIFAGQEQWFYGTAQKIADCESEDDYEEIEWDIELFISYLEWLQHSNLYLRGVNQLDIHELTELPRELSLSFLFHHSELDEILLLAVKKNKLILVSAPKHTIGIYLQDNRIFMLDPMYNKLQPKIIKNLDELKIELVRSLFQRDYLPDCRLPLEFMVLSNLDDHNISDNAEKLYSRLIENCGDINQPGLDGITNMHLACESGNKKEVKQLLKAGADPNYVCNNEWSPLQVSSLRGDFSIVKLLLKHGAKPYISNRHGEKPIDLAREAGHEEIVQLLTFG